MFRLQGHVIPDKKAIWIGLTMVFGIGLPKSRTLLTKLNIPFEKKVRDLTEEEIKAISDEVKEMVVENDLRREVAASIKRLKEVKCYRGMRHNLGLPVRGQRTIRHAKTAKKLLGRARVRPVLKK
jgi:small subunit ribosomal protein S13